jgi:hypothetical protein
LPEALTSGIALVLLQVERSDGALASTQRRFHRRGTYERLTAKFVTQVL